MRTEYSQIWLSLLWASVRNPLKPKKTPLKFEQEVRSHVQHFSIIVTYERAQSPIG